ncbi:DUF2510 domain-containing protein, partial [Streptomyces sp. NPDC059459]|uniref:DUF2510 domain-containing protein n=1 Tax=Streptomyces sp. NPDC059459 TaxID=3346839 RepID=UPI003680AF91
MSAPTPAPGDDRPREGYYPDPSIPGYVRYWNGASWVPGTSRPAPEDGEPLAPPAGARSSVEETGPHFFDEDPVEEAPAASQHGSRPEPATAWGADRSHQSGFADTPDQRVAWPGTVQGADPRVPHARGAGRAGGAAAGAAGPGTGGEPGADGGAGPTGARGGGASGEVPGGASAGAPGGAGAEAPGGAGGVGGAQAGHAPGGPADPRGGAAGGGTGPGDAPGDDARSAPAGNASGGTEGDSGNTFVFRRPVTGGRNTPAPDGGAEDQGTMTFRAVSPRAGAQRPGAAAPGGPGFAAGQAAAARAAAQSPTAPSGPQ